MKLKLFKKTPDEQANYILHETELSFTVPFLSLVGRKIRLACAAYELVTNMSSQAMQDLPISKWVEYWHHIQQSIDGSLD